MPRIVNHEERTAKRGEIIDSAQRLIYTKGYERMSIQDILDDLQISKGAFYHYFDSKPAVLEAFIERMQHEVGNSLRPIVDDPHLAAIEKLQGFFTAFDRLRSAHRSDVVRLLHVWYNDDNAIVRQKVDDAAREHRAPFLNAIVHQGIEEGVFQMAYPEEAGEVILALLGGMGHTHARLLLALDQNPADAPTLQRIVTVHMACMEAIERALGAPPNSLYRADAETVQAWTSALHGDNPA